MRLYHRTSALVAAKILTEGFRDSQGHYGTSELHRGVWVSDVPLDVNEGAEGDTLLAIDLRRPLDDLSRYEWIEEGKGYREWLVPASWLAQFADVSICTENDNQ